MALNQIPIQTINTSNLVPVINASQQANTTGTITSSTSAVTATDLRGVGSATVQISGTYAGVNVTFQISTDNGTTWTPINGQTVSTGGFTSTGATGVLTTNSTNVYNITPLLGVDQLRVQATAYTSGTANVVIHPSTQFTQPNVNIVGSVPVQKSGTWSMDSIIAGTGATNLGKAEDAAHASGDTGVAMWGVRNDTMATTTSASGDYSQMSTDRAGRVMVAQQAGTSALTNVAGSTSSVTILASNVNRIGATITNDSSAVLYLKLGATASISSYTVTLSGSSAAPFAYYEVPAGYTGIIDGIWASATGNARVTEIS